jgi:hypothetical protein
MSASGLCVGTSGEKVRAYERLGATMSLVDFGDRGVIRAVITSALLIASAVGSATWRVAHEVAGWICVVPFNND